MENNDLVVLQDLLRSCHSLAKQLRQACCQKNNLEQFTKDENAYGEKSCKIDLILDQMILDYFRHNSSIQAIYSEESGVTSFRENGYILIVDPLDGTRNFQMGLSYYATSIAILNQKYEVVAAFVANLVSGKYYSAIRNKGAYCRNQPICVQQETILAETDVIFVGLSKTSDELRALMTIAPQVHSFRAMGCAALDICCLATGRCGLFVDLSNTAKIVDVMAAALIAQEAHAIVNDLAGNPLTDLPTSLDSLEKAVYQSKFRVIAAASQTLYNFCLQCYNRT